MGRKRKEVPGLQEALEKPWCYYCEREFNDLLNLSRHQKAKHFKCARCGRRLNTAGGLSVHMQQVHKETLQKVENALEHRQGLEVEIFGMEGIPQDLVDQRKQRVIREFEAAAEAKRRLTGNPLPGMPVQHRPEIKYETPEELKERFAKWKKDRAEGRITAPAAAQPSVQPTQPGNTFNQGTAQGQFTQPPFGQYPPGQVSGYTGPNGSFPFSASDAPSNQPPFGAPGSVPLHTGKRRGSSQADGPPAKRTDADFASSVDDLIADARKAASATPTESSKPAAAAKTKTGKDKKKKDNSEVLWKYENVSPEEVRAMHPNYLYAPKPYSVEIS